MSYCQCRLKLVFSSIFRQFGWKNVALLIDRSDLFSLTVGKLFLRTHPIMRWLFKIKQYEINLGKNLEYGLKQEGIITFVRELNGNEIEPSYDKYLLDARMYARGKTDNIPISCTTKISIYWPIFLFISFCIFFYVN